MDKLYEYPTKRGFLKIGTIVVVNVNRVWEERIFIKRSNDGAILCVTKAHSDRYLVGDDFRTHKWPKDKWGIKK